MKKYRVIGNNLAMDMFENNYRLKIVGNNNSIKIKKNFGSVIMIGNNCSVDVLQNFGELQTISGNNIVIVNVNFQKDVTDCDAGRLVCRKSSAKEDKITLTKNKKVRKLQSLVKYIIVHFKLNVKYLCCI